MHNKHNGTVSRSTCRPTQNMTCGRSSATPYLRSSNCQYSIPDIELEGAEFGNLLMSGMSARDEISKALEELWEFREDLRKQIKELKTRLRNDQEGIMELVNGKIPYRRHLKAHLQWFKIRLSGWERIASLLSESRHSKWCSRLYVEIAGMLIQMRSELQRTFKMEATNNQLQLYLDKLEQIAEDRRDRDEIAECIEDRENQLVHGMSGLFLLPPRKEKRILNYSSSSEYDESIV